VHDATLAIVESLMEKGGDGRSYEEDTLLDPLSDLIARFDEKMREPSSDAIPIEVLNGLMEANNMKAIDLAGILGGSPRVLECSRRKTLDKQRAGEAAR
jgi:antitoxin component HigA of HigAB toxin-antitoxin module